MKAPKKGLYPPRDKSHTPRVNAPWWVQPLTATLARMKPHKLLLLALGCSWAMGATAQWQWVDKDGRKVFSDRPPPQDIPDKSILKQPQRALPRTAMAAPASPASAPASEAAAPASGKDKQLEENKAKADAAEAAKRKAEEDRVAKTRADNCARAKRAKEQLAPGQLVSNVNAKGERGFMDDATRAAELRRAEATIASDCK